MNNVQNSVIARNVADWRQNKFAAEKARREIIKRSLQNARGFSTGFNPVPVWNFSR